MADLKDKYITRIEGHGKIDIDFNNSKVKLHIDEGERLFEGLLVNRPFEDAPHITSRICGVCPTSHLLASIKAIESAFGVQPTETTILLRKLLLAAQICQSHTLHLYFLAAPDYLRLKGSVEMYEKTPDIFKTGLKLKNLFDKVIEVVGGRAVHPLTPEVGGFTKVPTKHQLFLLREDLEDCLDQAYETIKMFYGFSYPDITRDVEMMALRNDESYPHYDGIIWTSEGVGFAPSNYQNEIGEYLVPYSTAKFGARKINGKIANGFICGARARMGLFADYLNPRTGQIVSELKLKMGSYNPFFNNIAQAVEISHFIEEAILIIDRLSLIIDSHRNVEINTKASIGVGAVEAPRGLLYHKYEFDGKGLIRNVDIITPTVQNLTSIENDIKEFLIQNHSLDREKKLKIIEMLIRAFDPCITCSVH